MNTVEKFVASTTLTEPLAWQNSTLLNGDAVDAVARLRKEHPNTLVIFGSGVLVQSLMRRNLIDEYILQVHPLVLGTGLRLFPHGSPLTNFATMPARAKIFSHADYSPHSRKHRFGGWHSCNW